MDYSWWEHKLWFKEQSNSSFNSSQIVVTLWICKNFIRMVIRCYNKLFVTWFDRCTLHLSGEVPAIQPNF